MSNYYAGVDVGASTTKVVIIDDQKQIIGFSVHKSGTDFKIASENCFNEALENANLTSEQINYIVATGYGRRNVDFANDTKTEIMCHGTGAFHYFPEQITIIDIGGQDTKIIKLDKHGKRTGFKMNRKCAAGTGTFLEEIAHRVFVPINNLDSLARSSTKDISIGSYCTVFASTEILSRIREGERREDLVKGAFASVVYRILEMESISGKVVMTGGVVAHNSIIVDLVEKQLRVKVHVPPNPQIIGAFGAALISLSESEGKKNTYH